MEEGKIRIGALAILRVAVFAIVAAPTLTVSHAQLATSPWPMFHHDLAHTGLSQYDTSTNNGSEKWAFTIKGYTVSSPAIGADGTIYVGYGGTGIADLYAINPDGTEKWAFITGELLTSPAIGADGTIYVGAYDNPRDNLLAVTDGGQGNVGEKWAFATGGPVYSSPAIGADGTIYFGCVCENANIYAITDNGTSGKQKWGSKIVDEIGESSPAISADGSVLYIASLEYGKLYALNTSNGTQKWAFATESEDINSSPAISIDGETVYVGGGMLYAVDAADGSPKWQFASGGGISSPAIGADGTIYVGGGDNLYAVTDGGQGTVTQKWAFPTGGAVVSSPAIGADSTIYFGSEDANVYALNPDGTQKWKFSANGFTVATSPAIGADGAIYIGNDDGGSLYALGAGPSARPTTTPTVTATPTATAMPTPVPEHLTVTPSHHNFGKVRAGTTSKPVKITISNKDKHHRLPVLIESIEMITASANYPVLSDSCGPPSSQLGFKQACTVQIACHPDTTGPVPEGVLAIADNATGSPQLVTLTCTGK